MSEPMKPNYRTKSGVEFHVEYIGQGDNRVKRGSLEFTVNNYELSIMFEPLPPPKMVTIGIGDALTIRDILRTIANVRIPELDAAIAAAERESA